MNGECILPSFPPVTDPVYMNNGAARGVIKSLRRLQHPEHQLPSLKPAQGNGEVYEALDFARAKLRTWKSHGYSAAFSKSHPPNGGIGSAIADTSLSHLPDRTIPEQTTSTSSDVNDYLSSQVSRRSTMCFTEEDFYESFNDTVTNAFGRQEAEDVYGNSEHNEDLYGYADDEQRSNTGRKKVEGVYNACNANAYGVLGGGRGGGGAESTADLYECPVVSITSSSSLQVSGGGEASKCAVDVCGSGPLPGSGSTSHKRKSAGNIQMSLSSSMLPIEEDGELKGNNHLHRMSKCSTFSFAVTEATINEEDAFDNEAMTVNPIYGEETLEVGKSVQQSIPDGQEEEWWATDRDTCGSDLSGYVVQWQNSGTADVSDVIEPVYGDVMDLNQATPTVSFSASIPISTGHALTPDDQCSVYSTAKDAADTHWDLAQAIRPCTAESYREDVCLALPTLDSLKSPCYTTDVQHMDTQILSPETWTYEDPWVSLDRYKPDQSTTIYANSNLPLGDHQHSDSIYEEATSSNRGPTSASKKAYMHRTEPLLSEDHALSMHSRYRASFSVAEDEEDGFFDLSRPVSEIQSPGAALRTCSNASG